MVKLDRLPTNQSCSNEENGSTDEQLTVTFKAQVNSGDCKGIVVCNAPWILKEVLSPLHDAVPSMNWKIIGQANYGLSYGNVPRDLMLCNFSCTRFQLDISRSLPSSQIKNREL